MRQTQDEVTAYVICRQANEKNTHGLLSVDDVEDRLGYEVKKFFGGEKGMTLRDGMSKSISIQSDRIQFAL